MKPTSFRRTAGALLTAAAALAACSDQPVSPSADRTSNSTQDLKARVAAMGFRPDMIVDEGDHFRAEGDIIIAKRDLAGPRLDRAPTDPRYQYSTNSLVSQSKMASGITVNLSGISSSSVWTSAARTALLIWSGTSGTKIYFSESSTADVSFSFGSLGSGVIATGSFPSSGNPGSTITINTTTPALDQYQKRWVVMHELGHTIGYRHTNWIALGESASPNGANQIPGTPSGNDNASVFRGGVSSVPSWNGFSTYDQVGNKYLYPGPAPTLTSTGYSSMGHPSLSWNSVSDASAYAVTKTRYNYEFIPYDPQVSSTDGYWGYVGYPEGVTIVYGNSYSDAYASPVSDGTCYTTYEVNARYPSSKQGDYSGVNFDAC